MKTKCANNNKKVTLYDLYRKYGVKNLLVQKIVYDNLVSAGQKYLNGLLIDIGCGEKPLEKYLSGFLTKHIGLDHESTQHDKKKIDVWGTAYKIPLENESFDCAICTAVLEHLEEPEIALNECYRVLKPGGHAIYSVPFIWHLHEEPRDFYRFSKYGLDYLFKKVGFEVIEIKALSGFWVTFGQLFVYNIYRFNRGPLRWFKVIDVFGLILQCLTYLMDRLDRTEQWTWAYMVVVRKR